MSSTPHLIGYARVSTGDQTHDSQLAELRTAGCAVIHEEQGSGASRTRPVLARLLREIRPGECLVVVRLDRLARSVSHLLEVIETLAARGAFFRSLRNPIDTSTPQGLFSLQVLGAVAQLERALIPERTKAGMAAAKARGRKPGDPGMRARDPEALRKIAQTKEKRFLDGLIESADQWMPMVRRMRPQHSWDDVVRVLASRGQGWTVARLRRAVGTLVAQRIADPVLLKPAPRKGPQDHLMMLVAGI